jgi:hypothetical protein
MNAVTKIGMWVVALATVATFVAGPEDLRDWIMLWGLYLVGALIYFVPAIAAHQAGHPHARAITVLNVTTGWTFLGWVGAMIWTYLPARKAA